MTLSEALLAGMLCMAMQGAATTFYGPTLPSLAAESGQPVGSLGSVFGMHGLGFLFSTIFGNRLARRLEMRRAVAAGIGLIGLGVAGYTLLPFPLNIASAVLVGFGAGTLEVLLNRLVELLAGNAPAAALTRLHSTWGVGAVVIPLVVAGVIQIGLPWRVAGACLLISTALTLWAVLRWPEFKVDHGANVVWKSVPWRSVAVFVLLFIVYAGVETAVGGWATTFFAKLGQGTLAGALATSLFFLLLTVGRFLFGPGVERLGYGPTVRLGNVLGALALALTFIPALALPGFALAGLALSVVFTTLLAWAVRSQPGLRPQMASLSIASAGLGTMLVPAMIGLGVTAVGAWSLTPILIVTTLAVAGISLLKHG
jgi:FHS family glucose/mannose:H+ symporter-like MFS transporter